MKKRLTLSILFVLAVSTLPPARAQQVPFLTELISRSEEFYRLYTERRRAGVNLSALDPLRLRGEAAFRSGNVPLLLETLAEGAARLQGKPWDERQKFIASITLETNCLVVEPNQNLQVSLVRMFASSEDKAFTSPPTVTIEVKPDDSRPAQVKPAVIAERLRIADNVSNAGRRLLLPDGVYQVTARVEADGQKITEVKTPIYAISDFSGRVAEMSATLSSIKGSTDPKVKAVAALAPTLEFKLQRVSQLNNGRGEVTINPFEELDRIGAALSALAKGQDPFSGERGEVERAYMAADAKAVPYRVYVPKSYDGATPRPLVVMLHGALGDERSYFSDLYDSALVRGEAERRGFILVATNGRGRFGGYQGPGGEDAIEVVKAVRRDYRVDAARIYLTGHSMGGGGTWLVAASNPELFAAIAPVAGGLRANAPEMGAILEKIKSVPALVIHGARDSIIPPEFSRDMVAAAEKAGLKATYLEAPDADHITVVGATFTAVMDFFEKNPRPL
jgi:pimeloyl-ACP methyl ester carboxylesterase